MTARHGGELNGDTEALQTAPLQLNGDEMRLPLSPFRWLTVSSFSVGLEKTVSSVCVPLAASLRLRQSGERSPFRRVLVGGVLVGAILVGAISSPRVFIAVCPSPRTSSACSAIVTDHRIPVQICCCSPRVILFSASPPVVTSSPISTTTTIVFQFSVKQCETYKADLNIDLKKHHAPVTFLDKMAYWIVKSLRFSTIYSFS
ncbi:uncharacterized protein [Arachis hypogaea]|uniref:uncharacterized protein n=1 Tax=Arachis hypogaea TaxID=3818 RepID=UPI003B21C62F